MKTSLRQSGIAAIPEIPWGSHICLFYQSPQELLDVLVPYFKAGLENNEFCVWIVSEPLSCQQARAALSAALPGVDLDGCAAILPYDEWYAAEGAFDPGALVERWRSTLQQALASGRAGIRCAGNADWISRRFDPARLQQHFDYDQEMNRALTGLRMIALCEYSLDHCTPQELVTIVQNHQISLIQSDGSWNAIVSAGDQKTLRALQENETKFSQVIENSGDGIILIDSAGRIVEWNPAMEQISGVSSAEARQAFVWEIEYRLIHDPEKPALAEQLQNGRIQAYLEYLRQGWQKKVVKFTLQRPDGGTRQVELLPFNIPTHNESLAGCICRDITDRQQAGEQLALLSSAVDAVALAMMITDVHGVVQWVNPAFTRLTGYPAAEAIGQRPEQYINTVIQDPSLYESMNAVISAGQIWQGEALNRRTDGSQYPVEITITPIAPAGDQITHYMVILHDIRDRKRAERSEREQRELAEALRITAAQLNSTLDLEELLDRIVVEVGRIAAHDSASIILFEDETALRVRLSDRAQDGRVSIHRLDERIGWLPTQRQIYTTRQPLLIPDVNDRPDWVKMPGVEWARAYLGLPLRRNGNIYGILSLKSATPGFFTPADADRLQIFAEQASTAIENARLLRDAHARAEQLKGMVAENARLFEEARRRADELSALARISNALRSAPNRAAMLPIILDQVLETLSAAGASFARRDPLTAEIYIESGSGQSAAFTGRPLPHGSSVTRMVIETGQMIVIDNVLEDARVLDAWKPRQPSAAACLPLVANHEMVGALWVGRPAPFTDVDLRLLQAIADIAANAIHRSTLHERTEQHLQRLYALHAIDKAINASLDLDVVLDVLLDQVTLRLKVDAADMLLVNAHTQALEYRAGRGFKTAAIARTRLYPGQGSAGRAVIERRIIQVNDMHHEDEDTKLIRLLLDESFVAHYSVPLIAKGQVKGVLEIFHRSPLQPDQGWLDFLQALADQAAIAVDNAGLFSGLQQSKSELEMAYDATLQGWVRTLELRDNETEEHAQRVADLTIRLAQAAGIPEADLVHLRRGALLHDIGKMGIPDHILLKEGPLTADERLLMQRHTEYAYELLRPIPYLLPALDIPYCHHEKWDGTGYPRRLQGEQIPLSARLFAIADVWDALLSDRPYRPAWTVDQARAYILSESGKHFDPHAVELFFQVLPRMAAPGAAVLLVDDDAAWLETVKHALQPRHTVFVAGSPPDALKILHEREIALLVTEQDLPEMSGVHLLEHAHKLQPGLLGLLVAGQARADALSAALNLGFVRGFAPKPCDPAGLAGRIDQVLTAG